MEINKFKKISSNQYEIVFNNNLKMKLYEDIIIKYNLLVNKVFDEEKLMAIEKENDYYVAYYKAIKFISIKQRTKKEINNYLKNYSNELVSEVIDNLYKEGYLNDKLYIESYINDRIALSLEGPIKIKNTLVTLGYSEGEVDNYLSTFDEWDERINKYIDKKLKLNHNTSLALFKQKVSYELYNLGYESYMTNTIINNISFKDCDILNKEIAKLRKKYDDKNIIVKKLLSKGFSYSEIIERL